MLNPHKGLLGVAFAGGRAGVATGEEVLVVEGSPDELRARARPCGRVAAHDAKLLRLGRAPADDTLIAAYLVDPGRSGYEPRRPRARIRPRARPRAGDGGGDGVARPPRGGGAPSRADAAGAAARVGRRAALRRGGAAAHRRARRHGGRGHPDRHVPHGGDHSAARRAGRGARGEAFALAGEEFQLGSTQQLARILFEKLELTAGRKGKTGYSTDARVLRAIRDDHAIVRGRRGVARADEAAQHVPSAAADADRRARRAAAHDDQPGGRRDRAALDDEPEPPVDPRAHRARPARSARRSSPTRGRASSRRTTARSSSGSSPTSPASPSCARRSRARRTSMPRRPRRCSASRRRSSPAASGTPPRW